MQGPKLSSAKRRQSISSSLFSRKHQEPRGEPLQHNSLPRKKKKKERKEKNKIATNNTFKDSKEKGQCNE